MSGATTAVAALVPLGTAMMGASDAAGQALVRLPWDIGTNGFRVAGQEATAYMGATLAGGDVNGDGLADLVVGAPGNSPGGAARAGETFVVFGSTNGFPSELDETLLNGANGFKFRGTQAGEYSGRGVATLDFNGDSIDDVAIGGPNALVAGVTNAGRVYVVFGRSTPFPGTLTPADLNGTVGLTISGQTLSDFAGMFVRNAGDLNGDGLEDLAIGTIRNQTPTNSSGRVWVVMGRPIPTPAAISLNTLNGTTGFRLDGTGHYASAGRLGGADLNGDGLSDLIVGEPGFDLPGQTNNGRVYAIFGSSNAVPAVRSFDSLVLNGQSGFTVTGVDGSYTGYEVDADDVDGDGFKDLIMGAPGNQVFGVNRAGQALVLRGQAPPFPASFNLATIPAGRLIRFSGSYDEEYVGFSVARAGDVNGDGYADFLVGAPTSVVGPEKPGRVYLVHGGPTLTDLDLVSVTGANGTAFVGSSNQAYLGFAVAGVGDANGDGGQDIAMGAPLRPIGPFAGAGEAYVYFGQPPASTAGGSTGGTTGGSDTAGGDTGGTTADGTTGGGGTTTSGATGATTTGAGSTASGGTASGGVTGSGGSQTSGGTGGGVLAGLPWEIELTKPKASKPVRFIAGKRGLGTVRGRVTEIDLDKGSDAVEVGLALFQPGSTNGGTGAVALAWAPADKVSKVSKKGVVKFRAKSFGADSDLEPESDDILVVAIRASTNFTAASTETTRVEVTVR